MSAGSYVLSVLWLASTVGMIWSCVEGSIPGATAFLFAMGVTAWGTIELGRT